MAHSPPYDTIVLLPAYNEEAAIGMTLTELIREVPAAHVVVIDNNSTDDTARIAHELGKVVISIKEQGKGNAIRRSLPQIFALNWQFLVMLDADFTYPAKHIRNVVSRLSQGADVVMGYRAIQAPGSMPMLNRIGNRGLSLVASLLYGLWIRDVCTGLWGFRREALRGLVLRSNGFTLEAELLVEAWRTRCTIEQTPIEYRARQSGDKPKIKVTDGLRIGYFLLSRRHTRRLAKE